MAAKEILLKENVERFVIILRCHWVIFCIRTVVFYDWMSEYYSTSTKLLDPATSCSVLSPSKICWIKQLTLLFANSENFSSIVLKNAQLGRSFYVCSLVEGWIYQHFSSHMIVNRPQQLIRSCFMSCMYYDIGELSFNVTTVRKLNVS